MGSGSSAELAKGTATEISPHRRTAPAARVRGERFIVIGKDASELGPIECRTFRSPSQGGIERRLGCSHLSVGRGWRAWRLSKFLGVNEVVTRLSPGWSVSSLLSSRFFGTSPQGGSGAAAERTGVFSPGSGYRPRAGGAERPPAHVSRLHHQNHDLHGGVGTRRYRQGHQSNQARFRYGRIGGGLTGWRATHSRRPDSCRANSLRQRCLRRHRRWRGR